MNKLQHQDILILVVDDDQLVRQLVAEIFTDEGFRVIQAARATEALTLLETRRNIRLLFTDIQMPGKPDGLGLLEIVHTRWPHILLMVASGRLQPKSEDLPDEARFISKPFNPAEMLDQVNDLFSKHLDRNNP
jgi:DNA-binding NtrC family response regulator